MKSPGSSYTQPNREFPGTSPGGKPGGAPKEGRQTADELSAPPFVAELSVRENLVLRELAKLKSDKQIAESLGLALNTVHCHIQRIFKKLHLHSRSEAIQLVERRAAAVNCRAGESGNP